MEPRFLDTNVLLRYFTRDDPEKAEQALALLLRVERGEEKVATSAMVIFESVFTLQHSYRQSRETIRDLVGNIISLRGVDLPGKHIFDRAFDLYVEYNISFADAYNAAYMQARRLTEIYSWDADFDRLPDIRRFEPSAESGS